MRRLIAILTLALVATACNVHPPLRFDSNNASPVFPSDCEVEWNEQTTINGTPTTQGGNLARAWLTIDPANSSDCLWAQVCMTWIDLITGTQLACSGLAAPATNGLYSVNVPAAPSEPGATVRSVDAVLFVGWDDVVTGGTSTCYIHRQDFSDPECPTNYPI